MKPVKHVAIIMDGNGRWGIKKKKSRNYGHKQGLIALEKIVERAIYKKIKFLTLFTFSTENWKRPKKEINFLFILLENFLKEKINELHKKGIYLKFIGSKQKIKKRLAKRILDAEMLTRFNKRMQINLALDYGSKKEIINSIKILKKKKLSVSEKNLEQNLYTNGIPDPDILIRTGNTRRLSNFMLWQLAYTEIFFEKKYWPDFDKRDFDRVISNFNKIKRNFGSINE
jgi:undecaprenyl diphosphate synthase